MNDSEKNSRPEPESSPLAGHDSAKTFKKLFAAGVLTWLVTTLILFGAAWPLAHPENFSSAVIWTLSYWWIGFCVGTAAILLGGVIARQSPVAALLGYLLPVGLLVGGAWACAATYRDDAFRMEIAQSMLVFYLVGLIWASIRRTSTLGTAFVRAVVPAALGGVMTLGAAAWPVFTGNGFRYRNAFDLEVTRYSQPGEEILLEAVLEIRKPGRYKFAATRFLFPEVPMMDPGDPGLNEGTISWGEQGAPADDTTGRFPISVRWKKAPNRLEMLPSELMPLENVAVFEIRDADAHGVPLRSIPVNLGEPIQQQ